MGSPVPPVLRPSTALPPIVEIRPGIRAFDDAVLTARINSALASLPDDAVAAAVEVAAAQGQGVDGALVVKLKDGWSVMAGVHWQDRKWAVLGRLRWVGK
jgi:hypothetical protein